MMNSRALLAVTRRNLRIALRRPDLLLQTLAVPVVVLGLAAVVFGATDAWPVAVIDHSRTPQSQRLTESLAATRGATGFYFRTVTADPAEAQELVAQGRLHLVVTIPPDFATRNEVEATTFNINTDAMKNVRLRLAALANRDDLVTSLDGVVAQIDKARPVDVTRTAFMGGSAVTLALLLGAALLSANLYAVDTEHRTRMEMALTPLGAHHAAGGAMLAGSVLCVATALPTLALGLAFGTRATTANVVQTLLIALPAVFAAAAVGVLTAVGLRTHRLIQPTLILLALGSYFASGGFMPVAGLPPLARGVASWWPVSYVFEWSNPVLHDFADGPAAISLAAALAAALLAAGLALLGARRDYGSHRPSGQ